jgi:hypothetical protein
MCEVINCREGTSFQEKVCLSTKIRSFENLASSHKSLMGILKSPAHQITLHMIIVVVVMVMVVVVLF